MNARTYSCVCRGCVLGQGREVRKCFYTKRMNEADVECRKHMGTGITKQHASATWGHSLWSMWPCCWQLKEPLSRKYRATAWPAARKLGVHSFKHTPLIHSRMHTNTHLAYLKTAQEQICYPHLQAAQCLAWRKSHLCFRKIVPPISRRTTGHSTK